MLIRLLMATTILTVALSGVSMAASPTYDRAGAVQREGAIWYDGKPYYNMGSIENLLSTLIDDESYDEALFLLDTLEPLYPQNYRLSRYRAETYSNMGQVGKAADAYRSYFSTVNFRDRDSLIKFVSLLFSIQEYKEARQYLNKFHNRNGEYYYYYGLSYYREGLFYLAMKNFNKVPSGSSYYLSSLQLSIESCIALGQYGCARDGYALMSSLIIPGAKSLSESGFLLLSNYKSSNSFYIDVRGIYESNPGLVKEGAVPAPSVNVFANYALLSYPFAAFDIVTTSVYVDTNQYLGQGDLSYLNYTVVGLSLVGELSNDGYRVRPLDLLAEVWLNSTALTRARVGVGVQWTGNYLLNVKIPVSVTYNHFLSPERQAEIGAVEAEGSLFVGYRDTKMHHSIYGKGLFYAPVQPPLVGSTSSGSFFNAVGGYEGGFFADRYSVGLFVNQSMEQYITPIIDLSVGLLGVQPRYFTTSIGTDFGVFINRNMRFYMTAQYDKGLSNLATIYSGLGEYDNIVVGSGVSLVF